MTTFKGIELSSSFCEDHFFNLTEFRGYFMNCKHSSSLVFSKKENFSIRMDYPTQISPGDNTLNKSGGFECSHSVTNRNLFKPERTNAHASSEGSFLSLETGMGITNTLYTRITGVTSCNGGV